MENPKRVTADQIMLVKVCEEEFNELYDMQIESFMPLYEKYHDEISPALESKEKVRAKAFSDVRCFYFIVKEGTHVGAINIGKRTDEQGECFFRISPIFVRPQYQGEGIAYAAIQKVFAMFPEAKVWRLDTILQEPGNCHLYEKCGFIRVGEPLVFNENMTIVDYERRM